jgi:hypothetical protein
MRLREWCESEAVRHEVRAVYLIIFLVTKG